MLEDCKQYFVIFNFKADSRHSLRFSELLYQIEPASLQIYKSAHFHFSIKTPHQPSKIMDYHVGMRDLKSYHEIAYAGFDSKDYVTERYLPAQSAMPLTPIL